MTTRPSSNLNEFLERLFSEKNISIFISLGLSLLFYFHFLSIIESHPSRMTFGTFMGDAEVLNGTNAWRPRVFAVFLARSFVHLFDASSIPTVVRCIAAWNTAWLLASFLIFSVWGRYKLLMLVGITLSVLYAYTPASSIYFYPWDYPALFFYSLSAILFMKSRTTGLVLAVLLGMGFKETILVTSIFLLGMGSGSLAKRTLTFLSVLIGCLAIKVTFNTLTGSGFFFVFDTVNFSNQTWIPLSNLRSLFDPRLNHVIFVNAGTLLISFLLPVRDRQMLIFKAIVVGFSAGNFFLGIIDEYRIFLEVTPISLIYILEYWDQRGRESRRPPHSPPPQRQRREAGGEDGQNAAGSEPTPAAN